MHTSLWSREWCCHYPKYIRFQMQGHAINIIQIITTRQHAVFFPWIEEKNIYTQIKGVCQCSTLGMQNKEQHYHQYCTLFHVDWCGTISEVLVFMSMTVEVHHIDTNCKITINTKWLDLFNWPDLKMVKVSALTILIAENIIQISPVLIKISKGAQSDGSIAYLFLLMGSMLQSALCIKSIPLAAGHAWDPTQQYLCRLSRMTCLEELLPLERRMLASTTLRASYSAMLFISLPRNAQLDNAWQSSIRMICVCPSEAPYINPQSLSAMWNKGILRELTCNTTIFLFFNCLKCLLGSIVGFAGLPPSTNRTWLPPAGVRGVL